MAIPRALLAVLSVAFLVARFSLAVSAEPFPLTASPSVVSDDLATLQTRFDKEKDGADKVKMLDRLSDAQIAQERAASQSNDFQTVGLTFEKYRDNLRAAFEALKKKHPNAVKKPGGYKRLELQNQRALREVSDVLLIAPDVYKPPLQIVQSDMKKMEDELLRLLFPDRPGEKPLPSPEKEQPAAPPKAVEPPAASNVSGPPKTEEPSTPEEKGMNIVAQSVLLSAITLLRPAPLPLQQIQKDYLSDQEADKIRDAETSNDKIKLFLFFAEDRLKKFQYELDHPSPVRHEEMLNFLMNAYIGCVDDGADQMQLAIEKQENVRAGVDLMESKTKEFLEALNKIAADKKEIDIYKDNLDDAIEGTQDAMHDAAKAKGQVAPPPVRRKH